MRVRLFAIGLGIALLLPLAVYTGVNIFSPPPKWDSFYDQHYEQRQSATKSSKEQQRIAQDEQRQKQKLDVEQRSYEKRLFYVSFPVGIAAVILGTVVAVQAVGAGFMFGGIILLAGGCYSYWDRMTTLVRFLSVLAALVVFIALGYWKGRPDQGEMSKGVERRPRSVPEDEAKAA